MTEKFQNKYRNDSARLQNWDYRSAGAYFITICTHDREHFFGKIVDGKMILSNAGVIANVCWQEIKNHAKNIELGDFVIMPDHMHGIVILRKSDEFGHRQRLFGQDRFQNIGKNSISSIIGGYKSAVTKHANRLGIKFKWQALFYDHIIRDQKSFDNISNYIRNNPANWMRT